MYYVAEKSQNVALINKLEIIIVVRDAGEESVWWELKEMGNGWLVAMGRWLENFGKMGRSWMLGFDSFSVHCQAPDCFSRKVLMIWFTFKKIPLRSD